MQSPIKPSFHHHLRRSLALAMGGLLLASAGCKKSTSSETSVPAGTSEADVARAVDDARSQAKGETLLEIANEDLADGRYVSARTRAEEALASNPDDPDAHAILGSAHWRAGDFFRSTQAFERAVELDPKNYGAVLGLIRNIQAIGQHDRAVALAKELIADDATQLEPYIFKMQSEYELMRAKDAVGTVDAIFTKNLLGQDDPQTVLVRAVSAFVRAFEDVENLLTVEGELGESDLGIEHGVGMKVTGAVVGEEYVRIALLETAQEALIDEDLANTLGLKPVGEFQALGSAEMEPLVLIPEIKFGELRIKNVPAIVRSLAYLDGSVEERPGVQLGRQVLSQFGGMTFDFPGRTLKLMRTAPTAGPQGATEVPMIWLGLFTFNVPAIPVKLGGSEHEFWAFLGYTFKSSLTVTRKHFLKSGRLPRELEPPDDESTGLRMVYLPEWELGGQKLPGGGGLVLLNEPPDEILNGVLNGTRFELGGFVNFAALEGWSVTYVPSQGRAYIDFRTPE